MKLSIIIVSWNVKELLEKCLVSIERNNGGIVEPDSMEVIVVDNNSPDNTQEFLANLKPKTYNLKPVLLKENAGFAKGNNEGLKHATGELVLFLNPDTEVVGDAFKVMVEYMDAHENVVAVGPKLLNTNGSLQRSVRMFPTLLSQIMVMSKVHNFFPRIPVLKKYFQLNFDYGKEQKVDQVMGAALMVRSSVIQEVGEFDSEYRHIFEEVDLCFRIKKTGYTIMYIPTAEIVHHKGASFSKQRIFQKQLDFNQGMLRFFKKHMPRWQYFMLWCSQPLSWGVTLLQVLFARIGDPIRKRFKKKEL